MNRTAHDSYANELQSSVQQCKKKKKDPLSPEDRRL